MSFKYNERVRETSTTTGTGDLTLAGAPDTTYQTFTSVLSNGDTCDVAIYGAGGFESCRATYNSGANSITRGTIYASSNANARVSFAAGTKTVILSLPGTLAREPALAHSHGADVTAAGTTDLDNVTGALVDVTGNTTITAITLADGRERTVRFTGTPTITHGASLILPTSANIVAAAGDFAVFRGYAAGVVRCVAYSRLTGSPLNISGTILSGFSVGYLEIPQNSKSAAYTTVLADSGRHVFHPAADTNARTFTIDSNANVPYPVGTVLTFVNETSQNVTIAITSDTLTLAGTTTTGSRTLGQNGVATALKVTTTKWIISGSGLT